MKKLNRLSAIIALILIAAFILPSTAVIAAVNDSNLVYFYGDLNANGEIDKFDYILIKRSCMNTLSLTDEQISRGDVNNDGEIDKFDYILVKRHIMGTFTIPKVTLCEHELESINAKDATCDKNGNIAYFYCAKCEKCYSDAEAKNEITPESTVIAAKGHDYTELKNDENGSWKECACGEKSETIAHTYTDVVTPPTESEQGFTTHTCNVCGHSYTDFYVKPTASVGLAYTVNDDGITCTVTGIGTCKDTELIIPSKIDGYKVTSIGDSAFYNCHKLTSIIIPDSVTSIGDYAFEDCEKLKDVTIGNSVTSIGRNAFLYCDNLTSITIPDSVTSIGDGAFANCYGLTSVTIGNGVTSIGVYAFGLCTSLTSIVLPDSVTSIGDSAFAACDNLTSVTIGNSVTSIGDSAFAHCTSLPSITIPDSVTSIGEEAFSECKKLASIIIPDSVTSIGDCAFDGCTALTSVTIGNSVASIGDSAFNSCSNLKDVYYVGSQEEWKQIKIGSGNTRLTSATIHYNCKTTLNGWIYSTNKDATTCAIEGICAYTDAIVIPSEIDGYKVTVIGDYAFCKCTNLTSITIPDSVTSIGYRAFYWCTSLTSVTIGNSVTSIGEEAFFECSALTSITIPDSVTSIGNRAFSHCANLTSITIPDNVTSIGYRAFHYCRNLASIIIPDSVTSIGDEAFRNCDNLKDVYYAGSQEEWKQIKIGSYNSDLTSATIHYNSK